MRCATRSLRIELHHGNRSLMKKQALSSLACIPFALFGTQALFAQTSLVQGEDLDVFNAPFQGSVRTLHHGEVLGGDLDVENLFVPRDVTVFVAGDTHVTAARTIRIDGHVEFFTEKELTEPRGGWRLDQVDRDAPKLGFAAADWIHVTGFVRGGNGASLDSFEQAPLIGQRGGLGGSVYLESPIVWIDGQVRGGDGGAAAAGGVGGRGGDVLVLGRLLTHDVNTDHPEILGGTGGVGGRGLKQSVRPGAGGQGGDALTLASGYVPVWETVPGAVQPGVAENQWYGAYDTQQADDPEAVCETGDAGANGGDAEGGQGGTGGEGAIGSLESPVGGIGEIGGDGGEGDASDNAGKEGKSGKTCCGSNKGGNGGKGGDGGKGKGGKGGKGGPGGPGYFDIAKAAYVGPGGKGGPGGPGGDGKSGNGAKGGKGGDGKNSGGDGGPKGKGPDGTKGPGGEGGDGGQGVNGQAGTGDTGPLGGKSDGTDGSKGQDGKKCKTDGGDPEPVG